MEKFLTDFNLIVLGLAVAYAAGVFTSQWVKDKVSGVPSELRTALKAAQANALASVNAAQAKVVAEVTSTITKAVPVKAPVVATAAAAPLVPPAPVGASGSSVV